MFTTVAAVLPHKQHTPVGRQLILVDLENVVGGAVLTPAAGAWGRAQIEGVVDINPADHVIIATSHNGCLASAEAWPGKRYLMNSGPDGADLALLSELEAMRAGRYDEVVLVSGDGIFTDAVSELAAIGVRVTVVAHYGHCAKRLRLAAHRVVYLQPAHNIGTAAGVA